MTRAEVTATVEGVKYTSSTYMVTTEVAHYLNVSAETVRLWAKKGKLLCERTESGVRLFRRDDVNALRDMRDVPLRPITIRHVVGEEAE